jgi:hypothetical protein
MTTTESAARAEKIRKIEALLAGAKTEGERLAAEAALHRMRGGHKPEPKPALPVRSMGIHRIDQPGIGSRYAALGPRPEAKLVKKELLR